jgi:transcriptional regulator
MHPAPLLRQTDPAALADLVARYPLALIAAVADGRPVVAHAPVLLAGNSLRFHLSRNNAVTAALGAGGPVVAVVTGPSAYISPDWYGQPDQVPTWNYLSVEMGGLAVPLDDDGATRLLDDLSAVFEQALAPKPAWTRHKMAPGIFQRLLRGIVAYDVRLDRLEGTWKLGQNKPAEVREAAARALDALGETRISALMRADWPPAS